MTDSGGWAELMAMAGTQVKLDVMGEEVVMKESDLGVAASPTARLRVHSAPPQL